MSLTGGQYIAAVATRTSSAGAHLELYTYADQGTTGTTIGVEHLEDITGRWVHPGPSSSHDGRLGTLTFTVQGPMFVGSTSCMWQHSRRLEALVHQRVHDETTAYLHYEGTASPRLYASPSPEHHPASWGPYVDRPEVLAYQRMYGTNIGNGPDGGAASHRLYLSPSSAHSISPQGPRVGMPENNAYQCMHGTTAGFGYCAGAASPWLHVSPSWVYGDGWAKYWRGSATTNGRAGCATRRPRAEGHGIVVYLRVIHWVGEHMKTDETVSIGFYVGSSPRSAPSRFRHTARQATRARRIGEADNPGPGMGDQAKGTAARTAPPRADRRSRQADMVDIVSFNSTGSPQLRDALKEVYERNKRTERGRPRAVAVLAQEHQLAGTRWTDFQHAVKRLGWRLVGAQAAKGSKGGNSAGVAVAVPSHIGAAPVTGHTWDISPPESPGRLSAAWIDTGPRGGLVSITMYAWDMEGLTTRNVRLVTEAVRVGRSHGGVFIIGGDFNCTPEQLASHASLLASLGVTVAAANAATCTVSGRNLDFFLVDSRIAHSVRMVDLDLDIRGTHHSAVKIRLHIPSSVYLVQRVRRPKSFGHERPVTCPPPPDPPDLETVNAARTATRTDPSAMDAAWGSVAGRIEKELCELTGNLTSEGAPSPTHIGRAKPPRSVEMPMLPPMTGGGRHGQRRLKSAQVDCDEIQAAGPRIRGRRRWEDPESRG